MRGQSDQTIDACQAEVRDEGAPARGPIYDSRGREGYGAGERREGGSYAERMSRVVVWDTVMTEHNYLMRKWAHALAQ